MKARVFVFLLGLAGLAQGQVGSTLSCSVSTGVPQIVRAEGRAELVADVVLTCTGGTPTANGQSIPTVNFTVFLNSSITSRLLAVNPNWSEALLLVDDPIPDFGSLLGLSKLISQSTIGQFPCDQANGICPGFGNGTGFGYYGSGTQGAKSPNNRNIFQGQVSAGNSITWLGIPFDPPGPNGTREFRFTNIRVDASQLGGSSTLVPTNVVALLSATSSAQVPISNPQATVGFIQTGLTASVRTADDTAAAPNGNVVPVRPSPNSVRFGTLRFAEGFAGAAKTRTIATYSNADTSPLPVPQNIPGIPFITESGFYNPGFGTFGNRGNLGIAGLADSGTRLEAILNNVASGVRVFVDVYNTSAANGPTARLVAADANGAGGFVPIMGGSNLAELSVVNGTAVATWEVLRANPLQLDSFDFGVYLTFNGLTFTPNPVTVRMSFAPLSTIGTASATAPIPRFISTGSSQTLFTFTNAVAPTLVVNPQSLSFTATAGGPQPAAQTLAITSINGAVNFNVAPTAGLVIATLQPTSGVTPSNVSVSMNTQGLQPGTYTGAINVTGNGVSSVAVPLTVVVTPAPQITSVNPASVFAGDAGFTLTVNGSGFVAGSVVRWNGSALATNFGSASLLTAQVPSSLIRTAGTAQVTVAIPNGVVSNSVPVTITPFSLTLVSPTAVTAGGPAFTLTITGTGFSSGATVQAGGTTLQPATVVPTQITVSVPPNLIQQAGALSVTVTNPGGVISNAASVLINARPVITTLNPASVAAKSPAFNLTINGTGFVSASTVQFGNTTLQPNSVLPTQIVVAIPASLITQTGPVSITVINPGNVASNAATLNVTASIPALIVNPQSLSFTVIAGGPVPTSQGLSITSSGTPVNFALSTVGAVPLTVQPGSGTTPANISTSVNTQGLSPGTYTGTLNVVPDVGSTMPVALNLVAIAPLQITTVGLNAGQVGAPYLQTLTATGGSTPYTWRLTSGTLPGGLNLNTTNGQISGTPMTAVTNLPLTFQATDSNNALVQTATATFNLTVTALTITSIAPATVTAGGAAFTLTVTGTGFASGATVQVGRTTLQPTALSATQVSVSVPANLIAQAGTLGVTATNVGGASSNSATLTVSTPSTPVLTVNPQSLSFTAIAGVAGGPQTLSISSSTGTLTFSLSSGGTIPMTFQPSSGTTPASVSVSVNTQGLAPGVYQDSITITPSGGANSVVVPVTLSNAAAPQITSVNPSTVLTGGPAFTLTVDGSNFVNGSSVRWNGAALATSFGSTNELTAQVPASLIATNGTAQVTVATPNGSVSNSVGVTITTFAISSINPTTVSAGGPGFTLTINGMGFATGASVHVGSATFQPTGVDFSQISVQVPASLIAQAGALGVSVTNPGGLGSNTLTLTVTTGPMITSLSPAATFAGGPGFTLNISGAGFANGATVQFGGTTLQPTSVSATQVSVAVAAGLIAQSGQIAVTVTNPGGAVSNSVSLNVNAALVLISLNPASAVAGGPDFTLSVTGGGFATGFTVFWNSQALSTTFVSATQLTATVPASLIAAVGTASVTVSGGGLTSSPATFTIAASAPTITSLSASSVVAGSANFALAITGTGYVPGSEVSLSIPPAGAITLAPDSVSATQISVALPSNMINAPGTASITVVNPGGLASNAMALAIVLPALPTNVISGPSTSPSGQDQMLTVGPGQSFPVDLQGRLTLTFAADGTLPDDPAIQFQNGRRTFDFMLPAGSTTQPQVAVKTGTVAGVITITPSFTAAGGDVTPAGVAIQRIQVARATPTLTAVDCVRTSASAFNVIVDGFTNTREATDATFTFQPAAGANLGTAQLPISAGSLFSAWFGSTGSTLVGGTFRYTQTFNVQGNAADVGGVAVRLTNTVGASGISGGVACRAQ